MKPLAKILKSHKEYFAYISKAGKDIDKSFSKEHNNIFDSVRLNPHHMNHAIDEHYLRDGRFEIHEAMIDELKLDCHPEIEINFRKMHDILKETKDGNLDPAIEWATSHKEGLEELDSDLIFLLYQ
mmetsp:Transcript_17297/g.15204  ORF Transcript_17297/g.15204 Transcript_17297/m.15204 type:complete len:126 (-) Transcript_17297:798-1175(-)|eukprot:CAMPEP_0114588228 /NCGR_PEP_ID=MMETSP0125-20121206/10984_1 /TAXON_ID=485358 ORGANISM="Aristerostoma sp., Strain ATCC 50986" /NCGR_SAMPLE_ID=MMETSP0125 /ASSEMBLY_ACC=CAM_ASM_000245 /LENGTH=125 /DNA_ID=CAMNT_0001784521 /DNA_START=274 /DNA_END=651 /DNA_ORIENTATION=-